jgi:ribosome biogenesis GTPase
VIFTGHSGVGKSSIVNTLIGEEKLKTTETSSFHRKGKHTTTKSEMIRLDNGGHLIDNPGVKLFGIYNIARNDIIYYYREMRPVMNDCKYSSCTHTVEDGCAIL